jgi:hypothetical protein
MQLSGFRRSARYSALFGYCLLSIVCGRCYADDPSQAVRSYESARVESIDANFDNAVFTDCPWDNAQHSNVCKADSFAVAVPDTKVQAELKQYGKGDYLRLKVSSKSELTEASGIAFYPNSDHGDKPIGFWAIFLAFVIPALVLIGVASLFTGFKPLTFIVGLDGKYSNSKLQVVLWFWIAISSYCAVFIFRVLYAGWNFLGGINIPQNLLLLSGMSALTYGGAKAITTAKSNAADAAALKASQDAQLAAAEHAEAQAAGSPNVAVAAAKMSVAKTAAAEAAKVAAIKQPTASGSEPDLVKDIVTNDKGGFDFGDFQMVVVTLIAIVAYLILIYNFLHVIEFRKFVTLPDVDTTILALFGIGQGAYLAKKAGGDLGES